MNGAVGRVNPIGFFKRSAVEIFTKKPKYINVCTGSKGFMKNRSKHI